MFNGWRVLAAAAFFIALPAAAMAAPGYATNDVSLRAGPGVGYPAVDRIPAGAHIDIHGCLNDDSWCDVSWDGNRGWVAAAYLDYFYNNRYVYLPDYIAEIDVPVVTFSLGTYWSDYYVGRPWYHRRAYWRSYWRHHHPRAVRNAHHDHFAGGHHNQSVHNHGPNASGPMVSTAHRHGRHGHYQHQQFVRHGRQPTSGAQLLGHGGAAHYAKHHGAPHVANHANHIAPHLNMAHAGRIPSAALHAHASAAGHIGGGHEEAPHFKGRAHGGGHHHGLDHH